jgi:3-dehydroquinate synthase
VKNGNYASIIVLVDENTNLHCLPIFSSNVDFEYQTIEIKAGEIFKNIETSQQIWEMMMQKQMSRNSLLINLGGGVIGDMGGFCASTFKRGIDFIQMPTTLLSQVDASVGGKLGIDFMEVKNSIGVFRNPNAVFANPVFFNTLSAREIRSGFAEIIKHSLIASHEQWEIISQISDLNHINWSDLLLPSLQIKRDIVAQDPFEKGLRKALNFGHTIGHAIESYFLNTENPLLHGEAIAIGMICECYLSHLKMGLKTSELQQISQFIIKHYGKRTIKDNSFDDLLAIMQQDKKNIGKAINFTLLKAVGNAVVNQTATNNEITKCLDFYNTLD